MEKKKIKETIVVEGKNDSKVLKAIFDCETIETGGTSLSTSVFEQIEEAIKQTGVIIFTDPDTPGNQIRTKIKQKYSQVKEAFIPKKKAKTTKKVGVEHAKKEDIINALEHVMTFSPTKKSDLCLWDMIDLGLSSAKYADERREFIGEKLHIGNANTKTFLHRLKHYGIQKEELQELIKLWQKQFPAHLKRKNY